MRWNSWNSKHWLAAVLGVGTLAAGPPLQAAATGTAAEGTIGVYADAAATQRCVTISPGTATTLYVVATLGGQSAAGVTGAEFRLEVSNPDGYLFQFTPVNVPIVIGNPLDLTPNDPFDQTGVNIAFPVCKTGPLVQFGTLAVFNLSGGPCRIDVKRKNIPPNPDWAIPLFTICDAPLYSKVPMSTCGYDALGQSIASSTYLNDPACAAAPACITACPDAACVAIPEEPLHFVCAGEPTTLTAKAVNCSNDAEDIDLYIDYTLAQSFTGVAPGTTVSATRTIVATDCEGPGRRRNVSAVARNKACGASAGAERQFTYVCDSRYCGGNLPPDCAHARASVTELAPANSEFVPVSVLVDDPNGDALTVTITTVRSDERAGNSDRGSCPDAIRDGPNAWRLRAERDPAGDGRVYVIYYEARDPSTLRCTGVVRVFVPRKPGGLCVEGPELYSVEYCNPPTGSGPVWWPVTAFPRDGGVAIEFSLDAPGGAEVEVFDIRGRRVATVPRTELGAGRQRMQWDGTDAGGRRAAAGVYLFRVRASGTSATTKSVLLR